MTIVNENRYYFDTNALFNYYREQKGSLIIRRLVSQASHPVIISPLTLLEFIGVVMKYHRKGFIKKRSIRKIVKRVRRDISLKQSARRPFQVVTFPNSLFKNAQNILLKNAHIFSVGSNDCLHLAILIHCKLQIQNLAMVTSDKSLKEVCKINNILSFDPQHTN